MSDVQTTTLINTINDDELPAACVMLAHPIRWKLVRLLRYSDLRVHELCNMLDQPMNKVSYHLRLLRDAGLVIARQSDHDGRDNYYQLQADAVASSMAKIAAILQLPTLEIKPPALAMPEQSRPLRILFLCTHNSARSQMAEGMLRSMLHGAAEVYSAGNTPTTINPHAYSTMKRRGIDITHHESTSVLNYQHEHFDIVVTVCDAAREQCPTFNEATLKLHWSVPDPSAYPESQKDEAFERTAQMLQSRIRGLLPLIAQQAA